MLVDGNEPSALCVTVLVVDPNNEYPLLTEKPYSILEE